MKTPVMPLCVLLMVVWHCRYLVTASPFNMSVEGSGDSREAEFIFPTVRATAGAPASGATPPPKFGTTITRLKDFLFNDVVDFLKDNLLLIIVVTSLLVVMIFIICCASAMSHKRKLEAYYPPKSYQPRKYMDLPSNPQSTQARNVQADMKSSGNGNSAQKNLRTPSKALVGEKEGKDPRPKAQEVPKEDDEKPKKEETQKDQAKHQEEPTTSSSDSNASKPLVCTCHLRKANPPAQ
ncbi:transmembrane protein 119 [Chanos chanos]|uniref:Transmembrane protein 119 n=1 Tax=Chanos chanos TaxID=29144 RepID=A0A6J2WTM9_CHACN|nr:transmembrane protein 119 [Chanos chanos]